jgi:hypothetical protein
VLREKLGFDEEHARAAHALLDPVSVDLSYGGGMPSWRQIARTRPGPISP